MGITSELAALSNARTADRTARLIPGGLAVLAVGQVVFTAGEHVWLGAQRSESYFGPALLLPSDSAANGALVVGAVISVIGLAGLLVGLCRLAGVVDMAAALTQSSSSSRSHSPSARSIAGGLLAVAVGVPLYQAGQMANDLNQWAWASHFTAPIIGTIVSVAGLGVLLLGIYRLVVNIQVIGTSTRSSVSTPA